MKIKFISAYSWFCREIHLYQGVIVIFNVKSGSSVCQSDLSLKSGLSESKHDF